MPGPPSLSLSLSLSLESTTSPREGNDLPVDNPRSPALFAASSRPDRRGGGGTVLCCSPWGLLCLDSRSVATRRSVRGGLRGEAEPGKGCLSQKRVVMITMEKDMIK
ncbi:hypothetical protein ASPZODRAFT_2088209 [Penicilliopsis zonata CBS 506.65]|uniref:Uncharacterized protein n=1 Tax=Penicilliopsis zonata CBS 506.65 TaxID=1073090 RepID=A0A1L9SGK4_9EURO|nr:hypothetical protein ASPZODRAFT_2088209 [Penicilliopsis zonata CBS 506.65]OJJ46258.1 hypothetical protein ASPZODRAFT_2088209 [Penicilliopsis zonata CBS 506.65]